jgi:phage-related protein
MAAKPVRLSITADARDAVKGLKQTEDAAEDTGRELGDLGGKARRSMGEVDDAVGGAADGVASSTEQAAGGITDVADALAAAGIISEGTAESVEFAATALTGVTGAADLANLATEKLKLATIGQTIATKAQTAASKAAAIASRVLAVAMRAIPIFAIIAAIALLVAGIVWLWRNNETFRKIVTAVWKKVQAAVSAVVTWFRTKVPAAWQTIRTRTVQIFNAVRTAIANALNLVKRIFLNFTGPGLIIKHWSTIRTRTVQAFEAVRSAVRSKIDAVVGIIRGIAGRVLGAIGSFNRLLYSKGRDLIQGLIDGILGKLSSLRSTISNAAGIVGRFWPGSPVKEGPLRAWNRGSGVSGAGYKLGTGLADGMRASMTRVRTNAERLAGTVNAGATPRGGVAAAGAGGNTYTINVSIAPGGDLATAGRQITRAIEAFERSGGRRRA